MKCFLCAIFFFLVLGLQSQAKYETVVEGVSFNSASKVILDQEAIKKSKASNITELLATQANISVSNTNFQPGSIYLRGGDSSHILILVDGLPFYDASTIQKTVNLNEIDIKSIRRIEIIKGSQSVLYGGQALTGVIKIETLPLEIENKASGVFELGQYSYKKASAAGLKALNETDGLLARLNWFYENSKSPVLNSTQKYPNRLQSADVAYVHQDQLQTFFKISQIRQMDDIATTAMDQTALDIEGFQARNDIAGAMAGLKGKNGKLLLGYNNGKRAFVDNSGTDEKYGSSLLNLRAEASPIVQEKFQVQAGASYSKESFVYRSSGIELSNASVENKGLFAKADFQPSEVMEVEGGLRFDFASYRDRVESYQLGVTFFKELKFEYATGFKTPSLFQMYSVAYGGNPNLKPERAQTFSASYEHFLGSPELNHIVSLAVFDTDFNNLIQYTGTPPTGGYVNVARAHTRGVEAGYSLKKPEIYRFDLNLGYQEPWDVSNARWLIRRPLQTGSVRLTVGPRTTQAGVETLWNGERLDSFGSGQYGTLKSYLISNAFLTHQFSDQFSGYIRGNNLGNVRFESAHGFYDQGMFWFAGIEISN